MRTQHPMVEPEKYIVDGDPFAQTTGLGERIFYRMVRPEF